ncbi:MAG TPA: hypothetical protein VFA85_17445 [Terriglobales bacterium]|nr:hypothetical protein [Terriglobales bacterium]
MSEPTIGTTPAVLPSREENLDISPWTDPSIFSGGPGNGEVLTYDSASRKWKNAAVVGGGSVTVGTRASLPSTPSASGSVYLCTDADYEYFSDGFDWRTRVFGYQGTDPATDSSIVKRSTTTPSGSTSDTSKGGINFNVGTASGDHVEGYLKPVASSGTVAVALGFNQAASGLPPQAGPCVYDSVSGKWTFYRYAAGSLFVSNYLDGTGWVSNLAPITWVNPWPRRAVWGITFAGSVVRLNLYTDSELLVPSGDFGGDYTDSYLTAGFTHVGIAGNLGVSNIWWQFLKIVRT